jgi:hypothetical protein
MLSITDGEALARALRSDIDHRIKELLRVRSGQLTKDAPGDDLADLARFAVVQTGDTPADLERAIGFDVFVNPADGSRPGDPNWAGPGWEWCQDHGWGFELCFIMDDSGFGHVVIVPKQQGIDTSLLNLCRAHAPAHA